MPNDHLKIATALAYVLDANFTFLGRRFGLAALIGLTPVMGDLINALLSLYLVWIGILMGLPTFKIAEMIKNISVNFFIGSIPVVGDVVYIINRPNWKNLQILRSYSKVTT